MLDKEQVRLMFRATLQAEQELDAAREARRVFALAHAVEPTRPALVDLAQIEVWNDYQAEIEQIKTTGKNLQDAEDAAEVKYNEFARQLRNLLPAKVWFRDGDWLFGIAYDDWGGGTYFLTIVPYTEDPPSLYRRTTGD